VIAALLAALVVGLSQLLGWRGVDVAAQVYRVNAFRQSGFTLWDFQWYGGHWTLNYSVLYPPLAALVTVPALTIASAALAALSFDRLVGERYGTGGRLASIVFALGTLVPSAIGQLPFLTGLAFALAAFWAASRGRWWLAWGLAVTAALTSPLVGAFVAMMAAAWFIADWRTPAHPTPRLAAIGLAGCGAGPVVALAVLFPGQGAMPYPFVDYLWEMAVAAGVWLLAGRSERAVRTGCLVFMAVATVAVAVPSPLGGNVGRLEDALALPLAIALVWSRRHALLVVSAVPLALSQWTPAWGAMASGATQPSANRSFFVPLDTELAALQRSGPAGRVEVVPTRYHWEAAYVAPVMPLARGWERQLDVADNPLFYRPEPLTAAGYRSWLVDNGVRYVALAAAPLDMAAQAEARLVASGQVPGLDLEWQSSTWRLYAVAGSPGIVSSPAQLVSVTPGRMVVQAASAGPVLIRVRFSPDWTIHGAGCLSRTPGSWIEVRVPSAERFTLSLSLFGSDPDSCPQGADRATTARPAVAPSTTTAAASTQMLIATNGASR
jgi:hypothetical protein